MFAHVISSHSNTTSSPRTSLLDVSACLEEIHNDLLSSYILLCDLAHMSLATNQTFQLSRKSASQINHTSSLMSPISPPISQAPESIFLSVCISIPTVCPFSVSGFVTATRIHYYSLLSCSETPFCTPLHGRFVLPQ